MPVDGLKVAFLDFWPGFSTEYNIFMDRLLPHFPLELSPNPDYVFFSCFGRQHCQSRYDRCVKIFYTGENVRPGDFGRCDYSLSFDLDDSTNLRFPLYAACVLGFERRTGDNLVKLADYDPLAVLAAKTKFCNFLYSNSNARERIDFFDKLTKRKRVDAAGRVRHNINGSVVDKPSFIASYKFTIAFENSSYPGYATEKLVDPMLARSLPIYWGDPKVAEDFNPRSFINCRDYKSFDEVVERVIEVDDNDDLYLEYLRQPWWHGNRPNLCCEPDYLIPFFRKVFASRPGASR